MTGPSTKLMVSTQDRIQALAWRLLGNADDARDAAARRQFMEVPGRADRDPAVRANRAVGDGLLNLSQGSGKEQRNLASAIQSRSVEPDSGRLLDLNNQGARRPRVDGHPIARANFSGSSSGKIQCEERSLVGVKKRAAVRRGRQSLRPR